MALASLDDVNVHLPDDKLHVEEGNDNDEQLDAERIVKGELSASFSPTTLALWSSPDDTPGYIRGIAGRLVAALVYARAFSLEALAKDSYAQGLYDEAMSMLAKVVGGTVVLEDVDEVVNTGSRLDRGNFWPNADTPTASAFTVTQTW